MHPLIFGIPVYFVGWLLAALVCIPLGTELGRRSGFPALRVAALLTCCSLILLVGSKLLYVAETTLFPAEDYVPPALRGSLHGFRIPGGALLLAVIFRCGLRCFDCPGGASAISKLRCWPAH